MSVEINVQKFLGRLREKQFTQEAFADRIGVSRRTILSIIKEGKIAKTETFIKILRALDMSIDELSYNQVPAIADSINQLYASHNSNADYNLSHRYSEKENLWLVPVAAQGGFVTGFFHRHFTYQVQRVRFPFVQGECFGFEVEGYSMFLPEDPEGSYPEGCWVICTIHQFDNLRRNSAYVFQTSEGICLKLFDRVENDVIYLNSLSPAFPGMQIQLSDLQQVYSIDMRVSKAKVNWARAFDTRISS